MRPPEPLCFIERSDSYCPSVCWLGAECYVKPILNSVYISTWTMSVRSSTNDVKRASGMLRDGFIWKPQKSAFWPSWLGVRAHPTTSPPNSETPNGVCHVRLRGGRSAVPHLSHPRGPSAVLELSKTGASWSRNGCKKMGEACLATSTPKWTEIEHISKKSRG